MSIYTVYDYVQDKTADYSTTQMSVDPQSIMGLTGDFEVEIHKGRGGGNEERIILSTVPSFRVNLRWNCLSEADHSTLFSFYFDSTKACGTARSFEWVTPAQYSSHTLIARFDMTWESFMANYKNYSIASLWLVILGRKPD